MTLFFDRNVGRAVPKALELLRLSVEYHDRHFGPRTKDDHWLAAIGDKGWVAVTCDERLRYNQSHLRALIGHKVGCFLICGAGSRPRWHMVRILAANWDEIEEICATEVAPYLYRLYLGRRPVRDYPK
jgi:hypothetical protein